LKRRFTTLAIVSALALVLGCGGGGSAAKPAGPAGGGAGAAQNVTVKALDTLKFDPATLSVRSGAPVHLTLENSGTLIHDWVVDNVGGQKVSVEADGGKSASTDFTPTTAGTLQFYCSQPGHREAGMVGTLTVQ